MNAHHSIAILVCLAAPVSLASAQEWQFNLPGRDYLLTDRLISANVFCWFTANGGQQTGPWRPVEGRPNWTGEQDFWVRQIKDIMDANIDVMYVHLVQGDEQQRTNLFAAYAQLRADGYDVPAIAPFLDPLIIWAIQPPIDLSTPAGKDEFVAQYIHFFNQYFSANTDPQAESHLLHIGGKVVLNTWHCNSGYTNNTASLTRAEVESRLIAEFGSTRPTFNNGIYMVATTNGTTPSFTDEKINQFSAVPYYAKVTYNNRKTGGLKAGYWDQNIRVPGSFYARAGGTPFTNAWILLNSVKAGGTNVDGESSAWPIYHVNIESWNEYDEGSGIYAADADRMTSPYISPSNLSGNTDVWSNTNNPREYIDTTATYGAQFNDRSSRDARFLGNSVPATMLAGRTASAQIVVRNEGNNAWSNASNYKLGQPGPYLYHWTFDSDVNGWTLVQNAFGTSGNTGFETGDWNAAYGQSGGGLRTRVGGVNSTTYTNGASAAFARTFHLNSPANVLISFKWRLVLAGTFENSEYGEARFELDNQAYGVNGQSYLARFTTGRPVPAQDTGWRNYCVSLALSGPADHVIEIGAFNNRKDAANEYVDAYVDDVSVVNLDAPTEFTPARVTMDDSANEVATYGGVFRGRPLVFNVQFTAPPTTGLHNLNFQMLQEGTTWFGPRLDLQVNVATPSDFDHDNDVDQEDFGHLQQCLAQDELPGGCSDADFNGNGVVDQADFAVFLSCLNGPNRSAACVD